MELEEGAGIRPTATKEENKEEVDQIVPENPRYDPLSDNERPNNELIKSIMENAQMDKNMYKKPN